MVALPQWVEQDKEPVLHLLQGCNELLTELTYPTTPQQVQQQLGDSDTIQKAISAMPKAMPCGSWGRNEQNTQVKT